MMHLAVAALLALAQNDKIQANSYDDAWEAAWKAHCRAVVIGAPGKTTGFVLQIGDSITYSMAYGSWPRGATDLSTHTTEDRDILLWFKADVFPGGVDVTQKSGFYLAERDVVVNKRGMTAAGGIATDEYVSGAGNDTTAMLSTTSTATAQGYVTSTASGGNLQITTVASAFADAQFAVVMLGTNDVTAGRADTAFIADLQTIVAQLEAAKIAVILSTIPPYLGKEVLAQAYNAKIRAFAQTQGLPLIDFYAEIIARQPVNWNGTLLVSGDVHPSGSGGGFDLTSSPYASGGNAATHATGAPCANVGYLLRSWLTCQKMKEVKAYVIDDVAVPAPGPGPGPGPGPAPAPTPTTPTSSKGGGGGGKCGGSIAGPVSPATLMVAALAALALLAASRKTGF